MLKKEDALAVVAIDFGTTYSGYAYSFRDEYKKDHAIIYSNENWHSGDGLITSKTPTAILFDKDQKFKAFGYKAEKMYAEALEDGETSAYYYFTRYKMKLFQNEESQGERPRIKKKDRVSLDLVLEDNTGKPMKAIFVFSESIRFLKDHFLKSVKISSFNLKDGDIHWVLTVPAIWKDNAKQFMREAAKMAGIKDELLTLAYEPEAAAICCKEATVGKTESFKGCSLKTFSPGQQFMVLDCGGGTIDITSYEVQDESALKELDRPTGGPWGGTCVDQEYIQFLKEILGEDVWREFVKDSPEDVLEIKRKFEAKKKGTDHEEDSSSKITIPYPQAMYATFSRVRGKTMADGLKATNFAKSVIHKGDKLRLDPSLMEQFFKTPVDSIIYLVRQLLYASKGKGNHIEAILMVGGFSDSPRLHERVKREFSNMQVICPQDAVLAVVKGAVMYGHNPQLIKERICPRTYGITVTVSFDNRRHPEKLKSIVEQREVCTDVFKIMARKGEPLIVGKTSYEIICNPSRSTDTEATIEVYESINENPIYTIDKGVQRLGILTVPIPDVEKGKKRQIKIEMHFGYTELVVTASEEGTNRKAEARFECMMK